MQKSNHESHKLSHTCLLSVEYFFTFVLNTSLICCVKFQKRRNHEIMPFFEQDKLAVTLKCFNLASFMQTMHAAR